jgi:hypothetical protein
VQRKGCICNLAGAECLSLLAGTWCPPSRTSQHYCLKIRQRISPLNVSNTEGDDPGKYEAEAFRVALKHELTKDFGGVVA